MSINIDQIYEDLKSGVTTIAQQSFKDYVEEAKAAGKASIDGMKLNLQRWAQEVESGSLTKEDLSFLLEEQTSLEKLTALKQVGISEIRIDEFRNAIINSVMGVLAGAIKI